LAVNAYAATLPPPDYVRFLINQSGADLATTTKDQIFLVLKCESNFVAQQSKHLLKDGTREQSFGVAQINLPSHDVTYEQAMDIPFSVKWTVDKFRKGEQKIWTCWNDKVKTLPEL
jgi:hypothetical protein